VRARLKDGSLEMVLLQALHTPVNRRSDLTGSRIRISLRRSCGTCLAVLSGAAAAAAVVPSSMSYDLIDLMRRHGSVCILYWL
jgi:hypothetical protein